MSHQLAGFAGFLVVAALATPHLGGVVSPAGRADATAVRVVDMPVAARAASIVPVLALPPRAGSAPAYDASVPADQMPYGETRQPDFDPEHPPADMGEAG